MCSMAFCFRVSNWSMYLFHFASHTESIPNVLGSRCCCCCKKRLLFDRTLLSIRNHFMLRRRDTNREKVSLCVGAFSIDYSACHVLLCVLLPEHEKWMLITDETSAIIEYHMVVCLRSAPFFFFSCVHVHLSLYRFMFVRSFVECSHSAAVLNVHALIQCEWLIVVT